MPPPAALACYGADWRGVGALGKPAWLAELHPMDRHRAERWLAEVGEARFLTIAAAAAAGKRPNHRPAKDTTAIVQYAALYWLTHPRLNEGQAAAAAAREYVKRKIPDTPAVVRLARIMSDGLRRLTVGSKRKALQEAERLGLPVRADAVSPLVQQFIARSAIPLLEVRLPSVQLLSLPSSKGLERLAKAHADFMARMTPSPAKLAELERTRHLVSALEGLIPDDTPMSHVAAMFADMVAALQKPEK